MYSSKESTSSISTGLNSAPRTLAFVKNLTPISNMKKNSKKVAKRGEGDL